MRVVGHQHQTTSHCHRYSGRSASVLFHTPRSLGASSALPEDIAPNATLCRLEKLLKLITYSVPVSLRDYDKRSGRCQCTSVLFADYL